MSYRSRTYRHSNGRDAYRTNWNGEQNYSHADMGSHVEQPQQADEAVKPTQESQERVNRRDGYTMFRPDEKKRAHLAEVARRETEEAKARSEARRPRHIRERPGRVGGLTEYSTAINEKQRAVTAASKGLEMQKKREKWQREKREREERELQEKKAKARAQAERNEILRVVKAQEMMERHTDAHRRKNQQFLDRLERTSNGYGGY